MPRYPIIYLLQLLTHVIRQYGIFPFQGRTNPFGRKPHIIVRLIIPLKRQAVQEILRYTQLSAQERFTIPGSFQANDVIHMEPMLLTK